MPVITEEARAWAARSYPDFEYPVSRIDITRFARAIGETDPVHLDHEAATAAGYADLLAPTMFPYVIRMHAANLTAEVGPDGSARGDVPPLPTTRAMAGETSIEFGVPIVAGDVITVRKRISSMYEKEGSSGPLVFVVMEFEFTNQRGEHVATESFTRIYR